MKIEGTIIDIMETWPLQLTVQDSAGANHHVGLRNDTRVSRASGPIQAHELRPGHRVRIETAEAPGLSATAIQVLQEPGPRPATPGGKPAAQVQEEKPMLDIPPPSTPPGPTREEE